MTNDPNKIITLNLSAQEVNVIISVLQEMPFKVAKPLLDKILPQVQTKQ